MDNILEIFLRGFEILRENELVDEVGRPAKLEIVPQGFFEVMYGDGIALFGGMRSGSSPAGLLRCKYVIMDMEEYKRNPKGTDYDLGFVELMMRKISSDKPPKEVTREDGTKALVMEDELEVNDIVGLVNIELKQNKIIGDLRYSEKSHRLLEENGHRVLRCERQASREPGQIHRRYSHGHHSQARINHTGERTPRLPSPWIC